MSDTLLKVFMLEDMKTDQELVKMQVRKISSDALFTIAANRKEFLEKIKWTMPDIILADHHLPDFSGTDALSYSQKHLPHVPFVFVTGTLNDEQLASETILQGASAYILKDNLDSLPNRLLAILEAAKARFELEEDKRAIFRKQKLLLQKLEAIVSQASNFPEQTTVNEIIQSLAKSLNQFTQLMGNKDSDT